MADWLARHGASVRFWSQHESPLSNSLARLRWVSARATSVTAKLDSILVPLAHSLSFQRNTRHAVTGQPKSGPRLSHFPLPRPPDPHGGSSRAGAPLRPGKAVGHVHRLRLAVIPHLTLSRELRARTRCDFTPHASAPLLPTALSSSSTSCVPSNPYYVHSSARHPVPVANPSDRPSLKLLDLLPALSALPASPPRSNPAALSSLHDLPLRLPTCPAIASAATSLVLISGGLALLGLFLPPPPSSLTRLSHS